MKADRLLIQRTASLLLGLTSFALSQTCDERHYTLLDNPRRSVCNVYNSSVGLLLCDRRLSEAQWHRFSSSVGDTIVERAANYPVPEQHCGTHAPIYIRGLASHPTNDYATTNATVCANWNGNPCNWMYTIQIHRCPVQEDSSYYFLYKLQAPTTCSLSYCVGWLESSDQCEYWNGTSRVRMLLQLLLLGKTEVEAQGAINTTSSLAPPKPKTTSIITSTTITIKTSTTPKTAVTSGAATTTNSTICRCGPSGGAVAGIVISVLILYIVSLILVAILVSVLTKRGTIDLSNWKLFRMVSTDGKSKRSNTELAEENDYTHETHSSPGELYTALEARTRDATTPEPSPYQALQQVGGRKNHRNAKPRIKKKPTTDVTQATVPQATVPQATDDEIYQNY